MSSFLNLRVADIHACYERLSSRLDRGEQTSDASTREIRATRLALPEKPSIAVLAFQNMSGDPDQEYFADGVVDDIITGLSRINWLFDEIVAALTSVSGGRTSHPWSQSVWPAWSAFEKLGIGRDRP